MQALLHAACVCVALGGGPGGDGVGTTPEVAGMGGGITVGMGAGVARASDDPSLDDLAFMQGVWETQGEGIVMRETWGSARGGSMVGHFVMYREEKAVLYEIIAIEVEEGEAPVLRLRHFDRGLEPWASEADGPLTLKLAEVEGDRAVFENVKEAFPHRVVYAREGDTMAAELQGVPGSGEEGFGVEFVLVRP